MLKLGLIGCGQLGKIHANCVAQIEGARFSGYADIAREASEAMLAQFGGDYATEDVSRVMNDPYIDAVYICTRHDSHAPLAIAAAQAGKHILIEKPLALTMEECEAVEEAVRKAGVFLMPAFKLRYYPLIRKAHEFIPEPLVTVGQVMDERWGDDAWAQDPLQGGANVHSQGVHTTDILRFLVGSEPKRLWATGGTLTHPGHPCIDQCVASIEFENGRVASWIQGDAGMPPYPGKFFFELFGRGRTVQLHDRVRSATFSEGAKTWTEERPEEEGFLLENREFISALTHGREPELTVQDGIQATKIVLAADKSIRTGDIQYL